MVSSSSVQFLKANIVLLGLRLIQDTSQRKVLESDLGTEIVDVQLGNQASLNFQSGGEQISLIPRKLVLGKERITIDLFPDKSMVTLDYPASVEDLDGLAEITRKAIDLSVVSNQSLTAFGFNVDVTFEPTEGLNSGDFIANRVFRPGMLSEKGYQIVGGTPKLNLLGPGDKKWSVSIEPRFGVMDSPKVYMTLNLHYNYPGDDIAPTFRVLRDSLRSAWDNSKTILEGLNG